MTLNPQTPFESLEDDRKAHDYRFGIVVSTFNEFVTRRLLESAFETLKHHRVVDTNIKVVHVPGAFEIPLVARHLAGSPQFDAVICLGAVIRGDTPHFDYICTETSRGIAQTALDTGKPVVFGVLTADTVDQALERSGPPERNRGAEAARTAIEMVTIMKRLRAEGIHSPCPQDSSS